MDTKKQAGAMDYVANGGLTAFAGGLILIVMALLDDGNVTTVLTVAGCVVVGVGLLIAQVGIIAKGVEVGTRSR